MEVGGGEVMQWLCVDSKFEMFDVPVDDKAPGAMVTVRKKGGSQRPPGGLIGLTFSRVPSNGRVWAKADVLVNNAAAMTSVVDFDMDSPLSSDNSEKDYWSKPRSSAMMKN
jgi:hypothetical protein